MQDTTSNISTSTLIARDKKTSHKPNVEEKPLAMRNHPQKEKKNFSTLIEEKIQFDDSLSSKYDLRLVVPSSQLILQILDVVMAWSRHLQSYPP